MAVAGDTGTKNERTTTTPVGLFIASYDITTGLMGAPTLHVQLSVYPPEKSVTGYGTISQAINPPPSFRTRLDGTYTYLTVMGPGSRLLVTLTGYPYGIWPPGGGGGPVLLPNCELRMLLEESWQEGVASFWYLDDQGRKHEIEDAKVTKTATSGADEAIDLRQVSLMPEKVEAHYVDDRLVIHVNGHEDGVTNIHVVKQMIEIYPPEFAVLGHQTPAIGMFPYAATGVFDVSGLTEVTFSANGERKSFPVT